MNRYKKYILRGVVAGLMAASIIFTTGVFSTTKRVQAIDPGDCGPSSIITCGTQNVQQIIDKYNTYNEQAAIIQTTFNHYGIGLPQLEQLNLHAVEGTIYNDFFADHDVIMVGDKVVAMNARTAGREFVNGSTKIGSFDDVNIYERPYHLSNHSPKHVFILMDGERFVFGIIESCGNPLIADTTNLTFNKDVSKDGVNFAENVALNDGETATFRTTVHETTGLALASRLVVTDQLPAGFDYIPGSTLLDGVMVADVTANNTIDFGLMPPGGTKVATYRAVVHLLGKECGTNHLINTASLDSDQTPPVSDSASVDVSKVCVVTATCNSLSGPSALNEGQSGTYTTSYTAINTALSAITFSVDGQVVQTGASNTYNYTAAAGTHTISSIVHFTNNTQAGGLDTACAKTVTVTPRPIIVTRCDSLTGPSSLIAGDHANYIATGYQENTSITGYVFNLDGSDVQNSASNNFAYTASVGQHSLRVSVKFANGDVKTSDSCIKQITVTAIPKVVSCSSLTGPGTLNINESGTYTVLASDASLVASYSYIVDGQAVAGSGNTLVASFAVAGSHTIMASVVPKSGVNAGAPIACSKTLIVNELPRFVACTAIDGPNSLKVGEVGTFTALTDNDSRVASFTWTGVTTSNGKTATASFVKEGSYTIKVTIVPIEGVGAGTKVDCEKTITITLIPTEKCKIPGKEIYEADDKINCVQKPTVIVNTGPGGNMIGVFALTSFLGAVMHYGYASRRSQS